jgi:birA, biotin-[acetyl-CoA-carboxylase] ligase region
MNFETLKTELNKYDYEFIHINSTTSTMSDVKNYLLKNNKNCVVVSDEQTQGRGQRNNKWYSPKGNIYCSISFENLLDIQYHFLFSILISTSIKITLEKFNVNNIKFKWPNDLFFKDMKFCGIILENYNYSTSLNYMIAGFGINVLSAPQIKNSSTTYVNEFCNDFNVHDFLLKFYKIVFLNFKNLKKNKFNEILTIYNNNLIFKGKKIKIKLIDKSIISGYFVGVDSDGSLLLENNKKVSNIYNGSILLC